MNHFWQSPIIAISWKYIGRRPIRFVMAPRVGAFHSPAIFAVLHWSFVFKHRTLLCCCLILETISIGRKSKDGSFWWRSLHVVNTSRICVLDDQWRRYSNYSCMRIPVDGPPTRVRVSGSLLALLTYEYPGGYGLNHFFLSFFLFFLFFFFFSLKCDMWCWSSWTWMSWYTVRVTVLVFVGLDQIPEKQRGSSHGTAWWWNLSRAGHSESSQLLLFRQRAAAEVSHMWTYIHCFSQIVCLCISSAYFQTLKTTKWSHWRFEDRVLWKLCIKRSWAILAWVCTCSCAKVWPWHNWNPETVCQKWSSLVPLLCLWQCHTVSPLVDMAQGMLCCVVVSQWGPV